MKIFHLSSLNLWNLGKNKGRLSIYLPLKEFQKRGHHNYYFSNNKKQKFGNIDGIEVIRVYAPKNLSIKNLSLVTKLLFLPVSLLMYLITVLWYSKDNKPDIIYAHTSDTAVQAFLLSKLLNAKLVIRLYGVGHTEPDSSFIHKLLRIDLILAFKSKADLYILTNDGTSADKLAKYYGVPDCKIEFLKNGINKSWANDISDLDLKARLAPKGENLILTVSRLASSKQVDLIIKAIPKLIHLNKNVKLIIVGDGNKKDNLKALVENLEIDNYVEFVGAVEQKHVKNYMRISDLFVSMNALSSMSNPVFEAMICKKTVVALNKGSTKDLIRHNYNGVLIEPEEIKILPKVLSRLLNDPLEIKRIGMNAQKFMINNWPSWEERLQYEVEVVERMLKKES